MGVRPRALPRRANTDGGDGVTVPRRPSSPRPVHALRWEASRGDHRLSEGCGCRPDAAYDIAEPSRVVWLHRSFPAQPETGRESGTGVDHRVLAGVLERVSGEPCEGRSGREHRALLRTCATPQVVRRAISSGGCGSLRSTLLSPAKINARISTPSRDFAEVDSNHARGQNRRLCGSLGLGASPDPSLGALGAPR